MAEKPTKATKSIKGIQAAHVIIDEAPAPEDVPHGYEHRAGQHGRWRFTRDR